MDFLPKHNYRIYRKAKSQDWFFVKFSYEDQDSENQIWACGLTHKKIVLNLFKLTGGSTGYYLVDIDRQKFYYGGPTLQFIKVRLKDLNGLIEANTFESSRRSCVQISEKLVNPAEETDECCLIYEMTHINRFRPYEAAQFTSAAEAKDFAINKRELYQKFLDVNGGQLGFYVYKPSTDEVLYFDRIRDLKQAISAT